MKLRKHDNAKSRLATRQKAFDDSKVSGDKGRKRPGSMNPKKGTAAPRKRR